MTPYTYPEEAQANNDERLLNRQKNSSAVVVFSGGQDSTICLHWALSQFEHVKAVSFDYNQRHKVELQSAIFLTAAYRVDHKIIKADFINALSPSALTRDDVKIEMKGKLPSTAVDGRNLFFLAMAAVYAKQLGIHNIVAGMCQVDYSNYPDCRQVFIDSLSNSLKLAMEYDFYIYTPLMFLTKAQSIEMAQKLPGCMEALAYSHTCYEGKVPPCGECPACVLRAKGFKEAGVDDPLLGRVAQWEYK